VASMSKNRRQFLTESLGLLAAAGTSAAQPKPQPRPLRSFESPARALLAQMSLEEKVGQMTQPDQMFLKTIDDIENYHLGSLLSGGDSDPKSGNDLTSWTDLYDGYQSRALKTRLKIPLLYGIDAVHGHNNVLGAVLFPHNIGLGCTRDAALVERAGEITAVETRASGPQWAFAPCVATPQDIRWGRTYEGFSEDPQVVRQLGLAAVRGLQKDGLDNPRAVLACSKHYAGDGGTTAKMVVPPDHPDRPAQFKLDQGDTQVDEPTLRRLHLQGYLSTVPAGVGSIMPSYNSWNGVKCSGHYHLLTEILKQELKFDGFLISDYAAVNQLEEKSYKGQIAHSITAGMDMVMVPEKYVEFHTLLCELVRENKVPLSRIDDAVIRILRVKLAMGLMDASRSQLADRSLHRSFGSPEHRAVARECVRKSLVLLKNDSKALPIAKSAARIHVAGKSADNIGNQCGGWTVKWQGETGPVVPGGTTVLAAVKKAVSSSTQVTISPDGSGAAGATLGIAVIGETPYAEFMGDRQDLRLAPEDVAVVQSMKSAGIPVVVIIFSGRPLVIDAILSQADAIIAAFLPGTEGDGIADVLFGDAKPAGKLSFTWPKGESTSMHRGDPGYQTLFPLGFGLSY
jgi:beta-glucosidase